MRNIFPDFIQQNLHPETIFIIGGGPSIQSYDLTQLQHPDYFIITCNQAFQLLPHSKISHHSDYSWWQKYHQRLEMDFKGQIITGCGLGSNLTYPDSVIKLNTIQFHTREQLFKSPSYVYGNNCGLQTVSLAHLFIPKNIVLIGFDFKSENNQSHGYIQDQQNNIKSYEKFWTLFLKDFQRFEQRRHQIWHEINPDYPLPKIWNINPNSALTLYDQTARLDDFISI
ncbi:motility associated factor glycosyltransferase family protein [Acinetobacter stercoris]|uniref:Uncharacterized protein n=1 Tax=Acinetobacter stercoris TaxID=2126983 RepID=A0A2U3MU25_9GAMM|nr:MULTISPECIES: DUF115 domain-containing protein [Acinetobacter]SPL68912.1 hypothetical protein KPC_0090 [Acinetobacter stercoris]